MARCEAGHDGGHLGFLLFVALEVVAIPALATVLGALGS